VGQRGRQGQTKTGLAKAETKKAGWETKKPRAIH